MRQALRDLVWAAGAVGVTDPQQNRNKSFLVRLEKPCLKAA